MPPSVLSVNPADPRENRVREAVRVLREGGLAAIPTETFYGIAADTGHAEALSRVNEIKGKPADSPCLLLAADVAQARSVARELPAGFEALAERFWPGPLTLVVPAREDVHPVVTGGRGTVGVRVPGLALPRRLAAGLGRPITGVSANRTGEPPCRTAAEVAAVFDDGPALILDGGPTAGGAPSTIVDLCGSRPKILRHGTIPATAIEPLLPGLVDAL
jgi:L-threonylcarbamoyladenylate synthase